MNIKRQVQQPSEPTTAEDVARSVGHVRVSILLLAALATLAVIAGGSWARDILAEQGKTRVELAQARQENVRLWSRSIERIDVADHRCVFVSGVDDDGATITVDLTAVDRVVHVRRAGFGSDVTVYREQTPPEVPAEAPTNRFTFGGAYGTVQAADTVPTFIPSSSTSTLTITGRGAAEDPLSSVQARTFAHMPPPPVLAVPYHLFFGR